MKIILSGGGTIGSVTPLLSIAEKMKGENFLFVGTKNGPEKALVTSKGIKFVSIASGKFRRYFSLNNFIDLIRIKFAFIQSIFLLIKEKPDVIVSAGSFVSVPLVWAGFILRIPTIVHAQDIKTGLAIKLMKPIAKVLTKSFPDTLLKAKVIGNPVRLLQPKTNIFNLKKDKPVVLITGGGTGAFALNKLINKELCEIAQIIHVTGQEKNLQSFTHLDYYSYEFLKMEMIEALVKADLVITRAGLATLTELSSLSKPAIIIPMPGTHQELNAKYFSDHQAAVYLPQKKLTSEKFNVEIKNLLADKNKLQILSKNIKKINKPNAAETLVEIISQFK